VARLAWGLANLWAEAGRNVAGSHGTPFRDFALQVFNGLDEPLPERLTRELVAKWRTAPDRTVAARELVLASDTRAPAAAIMRPDDHGTVAAWTSPKRRFAG
jgi:hypothetical protein